MAKITTIIRGIDEVIFKQIDLLMSSVAYQKFSDQLAQLDERQQKIINQVITLSVILVPIIVIGGMTFANHKLRQHVSFYKQINTAISSSAKARLEISTAGSGVLAARPFTTKEEVESKLKKGLQAKNMPQDKVRVTQFTPGDFENNSKMASTSEGTVELTEVAMNEFSAILQMMVIQEHFRIASFRFQKNASTQRLGGEIEVKHLARTMRAQEE